MEKKRGSAYIFWAMLIFVVVASALVLASKLSIDKTKEAAVENINETYQDEFIITHSNLSKTPFKDTFSAIVQSKVTGASYNARFVDGVGEIPDYELETYHMTFNTLAEETFENSLALTYSENNDITMRVFTTVAVTEAKQQQFAAKVKEQYPDVKVKVDVLVVSAEVFDQFTREIPINYQRNIIAQEANFDNFNPEISSFNF